MLLKISGFTVWGCAGLLFLNVVFSAFSSFVILLIGNNEMVALPALCSCCCLSIVFLCLPCDAIGLS